MYLAKVFSVETQKKLFQKTPLSFAEIVCYKFDRPLVGLMVDSLHLPMFDSLSCPKYQASHAAFLLCKRDHIFKQNVLFLVLTLKIDFKNFQILLITTSRVHV